MTNREALIAMLQTTGYSDIAIDLALVNLNVSGTATYNLTFAKAFAGASIGILYGMLGVQSISEGGYSISYSIDGIKARINYLSGLYGIRNPLFGFIRDKSYLW